MVTIQANVEKPSKTAQNEESRIKWGWHSHRVISEIEEYIQTINGFVRNETDDEIARRCLSAIDTYGLIQGETPLELKFLLSVIGIESLLLGKEDKDFLGWKLREKVAFLFGDSPVWFKIFLNKETPTQMECDENRIAARADLAKRITEMYEKRSALVHRYEGEKELTEDDFILASMMLRFSLHKPLRLNKPRNIQSSHTQGRPIDCGSEATIRNEQFCYYKPLSRMTGITELG